MKIFPEYPLGLNISYMYCILFQKPNRYWSCRRVAPVLHPGDGGPQYAVDVAGDPHGGVKGEPGAFGAPGGVERDPR